MTEQTHEIEVMGEAAAELVEDAAMATTFLTPIPVGKFKLKPEQLKAAQLIVENEMLIKRRGNKRKSYMEIAEEVGVTRASLHNWRSLPEFQRYIKEATQLMVNESLAMATARLYQLADGSITGNPSIKAIELILTMGGLLDKSQKHEITVKQPDSLASVSDVELAQLVAEYSDDDEVIDAESPLELTDGTEL